MKVVTHDDAGKTHELWVFRIGPTPFIDTTSV